MIKHFLILTFRQFTRHSFYELIKLLGLSIGIAVSLLIMFFVFHEWSFDNFHAKKDSIYSMLVVDTQSDGQVDCSAMGTAGIGPSLLEEFPEITGMARLSPPRESYFIVEGKSRQLKDVIFADSSIFDIFTFPLISGNADWALSEPFTMVLTESASGYLFGDENPIGKVLKYNGQYNFKVTGIAKDPPANSHIYFNAILSFSSLYEMEGYHLGWDGGWSYYTYVEVAGNIDWGNLNKKLIPFLEKHINYKYRNYGAELGLIFDPLEKVYLHSSAPGEYPRSGNVAGLIIFSSIAFLILLIACINFMNLSTARFIKRAREVGVRKVVGASRGMLIRQFLSESIILSLLALFIAIILVEILLPEFNQLTNSGVSLYSTSIWVIPVLILFGVFVGVFAGSYPAFFMSSFKPISVIKGNLLSKTKGRGLRNALVVIQFFIATLLILATVTIFRQLNYISSKSLGYDKENILVLSLNGDKSKADFELLKAELNSMSFVQSVGASSEIPVWGFTQNGYIPEGYKNSMMFYALDIDDDYLQTMGIEVAEGRGFLNEFSADENSILINQALAAKLSWDNPVGKTISRDGKKTVVGVVKDFHYTSLQFQIEPLIISQHPYQGFNYLSIKIKTGNWQEVIQNIEQLWVKMFPSEPFNFNFLDKALEASYGREKKFGKIFTFFALLAILLAGLGLFGLASFLTEQRHKEIGIRKTFGAEIGGIIWWLGRDFTKMVLIGNLLAWPFAWYLLQRWLDGFAFHAPLSPIIFVLTLMFLLLFAFATVAWQSAKAARQNPVDAIGYE
jgi:putative ABC transport system permease protein